MEKHPPHPANVPGDFYVEDGCCTMCDVPFLHAPDLFGFVPDPRGFLHCHVNRQPETPDQLDRILVTIRCAEFRCIRYRGNDWYVIDRLSAGGDGSVCDELEGTAD